MPSLREAALKAASKARANVLITSHDTYPWLFIRHCEEAIDEVVNEWLQDKTNLDHVSERTGMHFNENPLDNLVEKYPIVWTQKRGKVDSPFPGKHLVIIALDRLDANNGLPTFKDKAGLPISEVRVLDSGEFIVLSGDDSMILSDKSGGISLFILLNISDNGA